MLERNPLGIRYHNYSMLAIFNRPIMCKYLVFFLLLSFCFAVTYLVWILCGNKIHSCILIISSLFLFAFADFFITRLWPFHTMLSRGATWPRFVWNSCAWSSWVPLLQWNMLLKLFLMSLLKKAYATGLTADFTVYSSCKILTRGYFVFVFLLGNW